MWLLRVLVVCSAVARVASSPPPPSVALVVLQDMSSSELEEEGGGVLRAQAALRSRVLTALPHVADVFRAGSPDTAPSLASLLSGRLPTFPSTG